jgi:hypothetical protein
MREHNLSAGDAGGIGEHSRLSGAHSGGTREQSLIRSAKYFRRRFENS